MKKNLESFFDSESSRYTKDVLGNTIGNKFLNNFEFKIAEKFFSEISIKANSKILDIGPGNGRFLKIYSQYLNDMYLIDISQGMLDSIKKNNNKEGINLIKGDFENYKFSTKFNFIISFRVFKYFSSIANGLNKVCELLNTNGYAVIQVPNYYSYQFFLKKIFKNNGIYFKRLNLIKISKIKKILKKNNCEIKSVHFGSWIPYFMIARINIKILLKITIFIDKILGFFLSPFGRDITIIFKKK